MTKIELQSQIQRKMQELPPDLLQEVYDYMEFILEKRKKKLAESDLRLAKWWSNLDNFSEDFLSDRIPKE